MDDLLDRLAHRLYPAPNPWRDDPAGWVPARTGEHLWTKQVEIFESVRDHRLTAVKACHGPGKSWSAARLAAWWIDVHPPGTAFVVSTAPTAEQVGAVLWREIGKAHRAGDLPGRVGLDNKWKLDNGELVGIGRKPADHDAHGFQGIHARYVLVIIDEACGVPKQIWTAAHALATNDDCRILAIGNPDDPASHFAEVCAPDSGWHVITISAFDTPNFTGEPLPAGLSEMLVNQTWVDELVKVAGKDSPIYTAKVLGEFPETTGNTLIPLSWVRAAQDRWVEWHTAGAKRGTVDQVGLDVAAGGADRAVLATRYGYVIDELETWQGEAARNTMAQAGHVAAKIRSSGVGVVDWTGVGVGAYDRLAEQGLAVVAFVAGLSTHLVDSTGTVEFVNCKAAAWWALRELLDPDRGARLCLPPGDDLAAELCAPRWEMTSTGKIRVESKDEVRDRIGRSTDLADAVALAVWPERPPVDHGVVEAAEVYGDEFERVSISSI